MSPAQSPTPHLARIEPHSMQIRHVQANMQTDIQESQSFQSAACAWWTHSNTGRHAGTYPHPRLHNPHTRTHRHTRSSRSVETRSGPAKMQALAGKAMVNVPDTEECQWAVKTRKEEGGPPGEGSDWSLLLLPGGEGRGCTQETPARTDHITSQTGGPGQTRSECLGESMS
jgi:hypothetical protein